MLHLKMEGITIRKTINKVIFINISAMKQILATVIFLNGFSVFAQSGVYMQNPVFNAPSQNGGTGNVQNNYYQPHLSNGDRAFIDSQLNEIHKQHKSAKKTYKTYVENGSNAGAIQVELESYLKTKGYNRISRSSGGSSSESWNGVHIYYGYVGSEQPGEDSSIIVHYGIIQ